MRVTLHGGQLLCTVNCLLRVDHPIHFLALDHEHHQKNKKGDRLLFSPMEYSAMHEPICCLDVIRDTNNKEKRSGAFYYSGEKGPGVID
jgi:hypothetical protein